MKARPPYQQFEGLTPISNKISCPHCGAPGKKLKGWVGEYYKCGASIVKGQFRDLEGVCQRAREKSALRNRIKQLENELKAEKRRLKKQNIYLKNWISANEELEKQPTVKSMSKTV